MKARGIIAGLLIMATLPIMAQRSVFEDDIYYTPKDEVKTVVKKQTVQTQTVTQQNAAPVSQQVSQESEQFDVDAYNRRYATSYTPSTTDSVTEQTTTTTTTTTTTQSYYENGVGTSNMEYAERIRRFHNPEVGLYVVDPEYNTIYLIEDDYTPYVTSVNIITSPWVTPWGWSTYRWYGYPYSSWSWSINYNPWYWNSWCWHSVYNPYYPGYYPPRPGYYPPRPYPGYRPDYRPAPDHHHKPGYAPRPGGNHGTRYTPGGSVGTGGRTDGATRYSGTKPSHNAPNRSSVVQPSNKKGGATGSYGGRGTSSGSNRGTSVSGGSFSRPSYSSPSAPSRQSYSPSSGSGGRISSGSSIGSSGGRSVGGRGSR